MSGARPTPGPWEAVGNMVRTARSQARAGVCVAMCCAPLEDREANARLIAAAPDMLSIVVLLESLLRLQEWIPNEYSPESQMLLDCRAALAKATGGQQ